MKRNNSIFSDIFHVMSSNFIVLISGIFTGFIVPMILGTVNYGYYKIFTLYASYTALLHFGFIDGILLLHGGESYNNLDKYYFRSNSKFFIIFQFIISLILIFSSIFAENYIYRILLISLGIYTFLYNMITYYQFVSQATMRFFELSIVKTLQSILTILFILLLYILYRMNIVKNPNFSIYISIILFINFILLIWYFYTYKDITFGKHKPIFSNINNIWKYFTTGFFLTISYQISTLILNLDSQFVSFFFNSKIFGIYSFAYSLITIILTILNAISTVLLPHMQQHSIDYIISVYHKIISYIIIIVYFALLGYFPLSLIIKFILPEYAGSLDYFRILLPGVGINCSITLVIFNYYNVLKRSKFYFYVNLIVLGITSILDLTTYILFKSPIALSFSSLISLLIWYIISEGLLIKWYKVQWIKNFIYMILMMILFLIITNINNIIISFIIYFFLYIFITFILYFKLLGRSWNKLKVKFKINNK